MQYLEEKELITKINSENKVYVQFSASWCGPCKSLTSYIEENLDNYPGINFYKVDVEKCNPETLQTFRVSSLPKSILFSSGKSVTEFLGFNTTKFNEAITLLKSQEVPSE